MENNNDANKAIKNHMYNAMANGQKYKYLKNTEKA